jgi:hypothetical protein
LKESDWVEIVHVTPELDAAAWQLFVSRSDKNWSLVDCSSFVLMQERGILSALTSDRHFMQAGFQVLLWFPCSTAVSPLVQHILRRQQEPGETIASSSSEFAIHSSSVELTTLATFNAGSTADRR